MYIANKIQNNNVIICHMQVQQSESCFGAPTLKVANGFLKDLKHWPSPFNLTQDFGGFIDPCYFSPLPCHFSKMRHTEYGETVAWLKHGLNMLEPS